MDYKIDLGLENLSQKQRIVNYWSQRSHEFSDLRQAEQKADIGQRWLSEITQHLPAGKKCRILDVGCGTGFFSLLLAELGHSCIGIDLTEHMILHALEISMFQNSSADFKVMDAEQLDFEDESFDMVISRNLTWTLPHPQDAYREWMRVLKKGGVLLNFDADYGHDSLDKPEECLPAEHAHNKIPLNMRHECELIKNELDISKEFRPAWDVHYLSSIGFDKVEADEEVYKRIYQEIDQFYNPTPIFKLVAVK